MERVINPNHNYVEAKKDAVKSLLLRGENELNPNRIPVGKKSSRSHITKMVRGAKETKS